MSRTESEIVLEQWYMFAVRRENKLTPAEGKAWAVVFCEGRRI